MQRLWDQVGADRRLIVDAWFAARGIRQDTYPRWLKAVERAEYAYYEKTRKVGHPAMVAKILASDGAPTNPAPDLSHPEWAEGRCRVGAQGHGRANRAKGSAIRLFEPGPVLGVAEGIEKRIVLRTVPSASMVDDQGQPSCRAGSHRRRAPGDHLLGDNDPKFGGQAAANALAIVLAGAAFPFGSKIRRRSAKTGTMCFWPSGASSGITDLTRR